MDKCSKIATATHCPAIPQTLAECQPLSIHPFIPKRLLVETLCPNENGEIMTDDLMQAAMATWAARELPARLDVMATAC